MTHVCHRVRQELLKDGLKKGGRAIHDTYNNFVVTAGSVRRRSRATESTLAAVLHSEQSTAARFARALHHAPLPYQSSKELLQLGMLPARAGGLGLGVRKTIDE